MSVPLQISRKKAHPYPITRGPYWHQHQRNPPNPRTPAVPDPHLTAVEALTDLRRHKNSWRDYKIDLQEQCSDDIPAASFMYVCRLIYFLKKASSEKLCHTKHQMGAQAKIGGSYNYRSFFVSDIIHWNNFFPHSCLFFPGDSMHQKLSL